LATSAQSENCSDLSILIVLMAIVVITIVIISHISGAIKNLNELAYKRVNLERDCERVLNADTEQLAKFSECLTTRVTGPALVMRRELCLDM
jgi:uncharacterized protein YoxC